MTTISMGKLNRRPLLCFVLKVNGQTHPKYHVFVCSIPELLSPAIYQNMPQPQPKVMDKISV